MDLEGEQGAQPKTVDRGAALLKFTLELLQNHPGGLRPRDIFREIEAKVPLDSFDKEPMKGSGLPRWRAALHFFSVAASKAGYLIKTDGGWVITEEGRKVATASVDDLKRLVRAGYREWRWASGKKPPSAVASEEQDEAEIASVLFDDSKQKARAEIDDYLDRLTAFDFQELVAALLEGMGYTTRFISPPGPDGGTDALAYVNHWGRGHRTYVFKLSIGINLQVGKKLLRSVALFVPKGKSVFLFHQAASLARQSAKRIRVQFT